MECETPTIFIWAASVVVVSITGIGIRQHFSLSRMAKILAGVELLTEMHRHADDYGFGTRNTNELLQAAVAASTASEKASIATTRSLRELIHYMLHDMKSRNVNPPPPKPDGG